jgi:hypothetical protein
VKNHKPFNKIILKLKTSTPTMLSSLLRLEVLRLGHGLEKELIKLNKIMHHPWVLNFSQMLLGLYLRSMRRLMISGLLSAVKLNIQTQNLWVLLQVSNQFFLKLVTLVDIVI